MQVLADGVDRQAVAHDDAVAHGAGAGGVVVEGVDEAALAAEGGGGAGEGFGDDAGDAVGAGS